VGGVRQCVTGNPVFGLFPLLGNREKGVWEGKMIVIVPWGWKSKKTRIRKKRANEMKQRRSYGKKGECSLRRPNVKWRAAKGKRICGLSNKPMLL